MEYETPELTAFASALSAIQGTTPKGGIQGDTNNNEGPTTYQDWE